MNYLAKDAGTPIKDDVVPSDAFIIGTDVDYYTDVNEWARYGCPMLWYTQVIEQVAGEAPDGLYSVEKGTYRDPAGCASVFNGTLLHNRVNGGASYTHPLWDWSVDHFTVIDWWGNAIMYLVEARKCKSGRWIVGCFPTSYTAFPGWCGREIVGIRRKNMVVYGAVVNEYYKEGMAMLSISLPGLWRSFEVQPVHYFGWSVKFHAAKTAMVGDVERYMRASRVETEECIAWAPAVFALLTNRWQPRGTPQMRVSEVIMRYGPQVAHYVSAHDDDNKYPVREIESAPIGRAFCPCPAIVQSQAPANMAENESAAHRIRVKGAQEANRNHVVPHKYKSYATEFVDMVLADIRGTGVPLTLDELYDQHWTRPAQQRDRDRVDVLECFNEKLKGFMKAEFGPKPRMITDFPSEQKAPLGCYTHAAMAALKDRFSWVGCGRTPEWVAQRVADIATGKDVPDRLKPSAPSCSEGDITNCDGSELRFDREHIVDPILFGFFQSAYRDELRNHLKFERPTSGQYSTDKRYVYMAKGHRYEMSWELGSGSSRTTFANIMKCVFREYCALRAVGFGPAEAFRLLGLQCGDDSVMHDFAFGDISAVRVRVAKDLGMEMKIIARRSANEDPVTFLGEYYLDAWSGGTVRVPDFWRQITKVNLTTNRVVTPEQAAMNKAAGILSSCGRWCPALGPWADAVIRITGAAGLRPKDMTKTEMWKYINEVVVAQPDTNEEVRERIRDNWLVVNGVDGAVLNNFVEACKSATTLSGLPSAVFDNVERAKPPMDSYVDTGRQAPSYLNAKQSKETTDRGGREQQHGSPRGSGKAPTGSASEIKSEAEESGGAATAGAALAAECTHALQSLLAPCGGCADLRRISGHDYGLPGADERHSVDGRSGGGADVDSAQSGVQLPDPIREREQHDRDLSVRQSNTSGDGRSGASGTDDIVGGDGFRPCDEPPCGGRIVQGGGLGRRFEDASWSELKRASDSNQVHPPRSRAGSSGGPSPVSRVSGVRHGRAHLDGGRKVVWGDSGDSADRDPPDRGQLAANERPTTAGQFGDRKDTGDRGDATHPRNGDRVDRVAGSERAAGSRETDKQRVPPMEGDWSVADSSGRHRTGVRSGRLLVERGDRSDKSHVPAVVRRDVPGHDGSRRSSGGGERGGGKHVDPRLRGDLPHRGNPTRGRTADNAPAAGRGQRERSPDRRAGSDRPRANAPLPVGSAPLSRDGKRRAGGPKRSDEPSGNRGGRSNRGAGRGPRDELRARGCDGRSDPVIGFSDDECAKTDSQLEAWFRRQEDEYGDDDMI